MEPTSIPQFKDISWRWIAYAASAIVVVAIGFGFLHEVELKQDVQCEIVSPSEVKVRGLAGLVTSVYVHPSERVASGARLFTLQRDLSLSSDGRQRNVFDAQMRDEQIRVADEQYAQRKAQLAAQRDASSLTGASRRAELSALNEQITQNRQLSDESQQKLARLKSVSDYVTADRIEQASADEHQVKVSIAQGIARREQLLRRDIDAQRHADRPRCATERERRQARTKHSGNPDALRAIAPRRNDLGTAGGSRYVFETRAGSHAGGIRRRARHRDGREGRVAGRAAHSVAASRVRRKRSDRAA
jgi:multidrug resistance efflux pump